MDLAYCEILLCFSRCFWRCLLRRLVAMELAVSVAVSLNWTVRGVFRGCFGGLRAFFGLFFRGGLCRLGVSIVLVVCRTWGDC
jgi:hypothetical protein